MRCMVRAASCEPQHSINKRRRDNLLLQLSDDEDDEDSPVQSQGDPNKPWLKEFNRYLSGMEMIPEKMSLVSWWGVSAHFLFHIHT